MTPKEKAQELVDKFCKQTRWKMGQEDYIKRAKQCALIAVDEILKVLNPENWGLEMDSAFESMEYWQKVKKEIEAL